MEIRYQREMKHNYLIVKPDDQNTDFYEVHMMAGNTIEGLLKMHVKHTEDETLYCYEITSKQPLSRILESRGMKAAEMKKLILEISNVLDRMEVYLLREDSIWLDGEYIYIEPETYQINLCLVPGLNRNFPADMKKLLQYLLGRIDHTDKKGVVLAYSLFQESQKENYGMKNLLQVLRDSGEGMEERETREDNKGGREEEEWKENGDGFSHNREQSQNHRIREIEEKDLEKQKKREKRKTPIGTGGKWFVGLLLILLGAAGAAGSYILEADPIKKYGIKAGAAVLLAVAAVFLLKKDREEGQPDPEMSKKKKNDKRSQDFWIVELENQAEEPERPGEPADAKISAGTKAPAAANDTALLVDLEQKRETRRLISLDKGGEEVPISHYPFIIGKQEELVDYVMRYDTVSRLHIRIDREGEEYKVTDLNSTNGTIVRGHLMETNESVPISPGDEIYIADKGFLFV